ncbi:MAG: serine/threonine-protein kinase [Candidatus Dormibacteria bacterium]
MPVDDVPRGPGGTGWRVPGYTGRQGIGVDRAGALVAATEDATGRRVVLRVLSPALAGDPSVMQRLRQALPALTAVRDDHLVPVLGMAEPPPALVYGAFAGPTLTGVIDRAGAVPHAAAFLILDDVLVALATLHAAGLTHGDVRPGSIVVGEEGSARLFDTLVPVPPLRPGASPGTPQYMAPELWAGGRATVATDLYAASAVFVEALSGAPPFPMLDLEGLRRAHESVTLADPRLPAAARGLAMQGLAKDPSSRPNDAVQFREDLDTAARGLLEDDWRERGRAWLVGAHRTTARVVQPLPTASPPQPILEVAEPLVPSRPWWRDPRVLAGAAIAAVVLVIVVLLAVSAAKNEPVDTTPTAAPSGAQTTPTPIFSASSTATAASPSSTPTSGPTITASPSRIPTSSGGVSFGPGTPSPSACIPLITPCP